MSSDNDGCLGGLGNILFILLLVICAYYVLKFDDVEACFDICHEQGQSMKGFSLISSHCYCDREPQGTNDEKEEIK